eukprot:763314-Hanusia_phi.AAC.1
MVPKKREDKKTSSALPRRPPPPRSQLPEGVEEIDLLAGQFKFERRREKGAREDKISEEEADELRQKTKHLVKLQVSFYPPTLPSPPFCSFLHLDELREEVALAEAAVAAGRQDAEERAARARARLEEEEEALWSQRENGRQYEDEYDDAFEAFASLDMGEGLAETEGKTRWRMVVGRDEGVSCYILLWSWRAEVTQEGEGEGEEEEVFLGVERNVNRQVLACFPPLRSPLLPYPPLPSPSLNPSFLHPPTPQTSAGGRGGTRRSQHGPDQLVFKRRRKGQGQRRRRKRRRAWREGWSSARAESDTGKRMGQSQRPPDQVRQVRGLREGGVTLLAGGRKKTRAPSPTITARTEPRGR